MLTNEFWKALFSIMGYTGSSGDTSVTFGMKRPGGSASSSAPTGPKIADMGRLLSCMKTLSTSEETDKYTTSMSVWLGDGTTPPTLSDITISGNKIHGFTYTVEVEGVGDSDGATLTAVYTITNPTSEEMIINEIALFGGYQIGNLNYPYLIDRTLLDEPVIISAGGFGSVTYTIRLNFPTA